jgi:hypothetical protein
MLSGTEVENIESYNVASEVFHRLLPAEKKANIELMGFGGGPIARGASKSILFRPSILGLCNQPIWLPPFLGSGGCVIELHLANPELFLAAGVDQSQAYSLSNVRALCDVYTLDSGLSNTYAQHILSGKALSIPMKSLVVTTFQLNAGNPSFDVNVARSISRLNSVFVTLHGQTGPQVQDVNTFIAANPEAIQGRVQIGSKQWPDGQNVTGLSQFWYRLLSGLGVFHSASHTVDITRAQYETDHFIWCSDTETLPVATGTGFSCAKGELITVSMRNLGNTHQRASVICHHDVIVEIRDTGVDCLV